MSQQTVPKPLPDALQAYRRTPVFDQNSLPTALRKEHSTKQGVWALIHVLEGQVQYCIPGQDYRCVLTPGISGLIEPQQVHFVEPIGQMRMYVEFYAAAPA